LCETLDSKATSGEKNYRKWSKYLLGCSDWDYQDNFALSIDETKHLEKSLAQLQKSSA